MLTTIGEKIVEIRPKQIIESNVLVDNHYLIPLNKRSDPHYKYVSKKKQTDEKLPEHSSRNTEASA